MTYDLSGGATSSFMGLWEAVAWVGSRDFAVASDVRVDVAKWRTDTGGRVSALTPLFAHPLDIESAFAQISDHCATGGLLAKGRGTEGFQTVPADDWHEAVIVGVDQPDTIMIPPTLPFGPYGELITAGELWLLDALLQVQSISPKQDQRLRDIELKIERARPC